MEFFFRNFVGTKKRATCDAIHEQHGNGCYDLYTVAFNFILPLACNFCGKNEGRLSKITLYVGGKKRVDRKQPNCKAEQRDEENLKLSQFGTYKVDVSCFVSRAAASIFLLLSRPYSAGLMCLCIGICAYCLLYSFAAFILFERRIENYFIHTIEFCEFFPFILQDETTNTTSRSELSFVPSTEDDGKSITCRAENPKVTGLYLETTWKLNVVCEYIYERNIKIHSTAIIFSFLF